MKSITTKYIDEKKRKEYIYYIVILYYNWYLYIYIYISIKDSLYKFENILVAQLCFFIFLSKCTSYMTFISWVSVIYHGIDLLVFNIWHVILSLTFSGLPFQYSKIHLCYFYLFIWNIYCIFLFYYTIFMIYPFRLFD